MYSFTINGNSVTVDGDPRTPLLWVIRDQLNLKGTKFGCGAGLCGSCTVHLNGTDVRSCLTFLGDVEGAEITTIEGLAPDYDHPLQRAWVAENVTQCGYCQSGQIMRAATLLAENSNPTREEIVEHMNANLCRCGTYPRIVRAIERAAREE